MIENNKKSTWVYLIRIVFICIFILNILGAFYFYAERGERDTLDLVLIGLICFLVGIKIGGNSLLNKKKKVSYTPTIREIQKSTQLQLRSFCVIAILFAASFILSTSLFVERGIPLFSSNNNLLRSTFGVGTMGRIRALVTWCPLSGLMIFCLMQINKKFKRPAIIIIGITFIFLAFYSFKGNLVWFAAMLFIVYTALKKKLQIAKGIIVASGIFIIIVFVFSIWLSVEYSVALDSLVKRITRDQVDGLHFIITNYVPSIGFKYGKHFVAQMTDTFFSVYEESFDIQLARLFYGRNVTWGIVQTLYGFLYFDFGKCGVALGFLIFGVVVKMVEKDLLDVDNQTIPSLCYNSYLVYILIKIFLVGNVFNELKGLLLSVIVFNFLYTMIYSIMFNNGYLRKKTNRIIKSNK